MKAKFNVGDRVAMKGVCTDDRYVIFGTVVLTPSERNHSYSVEYDGGWNMDEAEPNYLCPTCRCGVAEDSLLPDVGFTDRRPYWIGDRLVVAALVGERAMNNHVKELVLLHESSEAPGVYICDHVPLVSDNAEPGDEIVCGDCSDLLNAGAEIKRMSTEAVRA